MVRASVTALALAAFASGGCRGPAAAPARAATAPLDGTSVVLLDGRGVGWEELLAARDTTLAVFATTWCEVCRREQPAVEAWARAHAAVTVVYVFSGDDLPTVLAVAARRQLGAGAVTVVVDADGRVADRYGITVTPTLLVLDRAGAEHAVHHRLEEVRVEGSGTTRDGR
jgi:thiol-disulfide isomerase/thioredoxin